MTSMSQRLMAKVVELHMPSSIRDAALAKGSGYCDLTARSAPAPFFISPQPRSGKDEKCVEHKAQRIPAPEFTPPYLKASKDRELRLVCPEPAVPTLNQFVDIMGEPPSLKTVYVPAHLEVNTRFVWLLTRLVHGYPLGNYMQDIAATPEPLPVPIPTWPYVPNDVAVCAFACLLAPHLSDAKIRGPVHHLLQLCGKHQFFHPHVLASGQIAAMLFHALQDLVLRLSVTDHKVQETFDFKRPTFAKDKSFHYGKETIAGDSVIFKSLITNDQDFFYLQFYLQVCLNMIWDEGRLPEDAPAWPHPAEFFQTVENARRWVIVLEAVRRLIAPVLPSLSSLEAFAKECTRRSGLYLTPRHPLLDRAHVHAKHVAMLHQSCIELASVAHRLIGSGPETFTSRAADFHPGRLDLHVSYVSSVGVHSEPIRQCFDNTPDGSIPAMLLIDFKMALKDGEPRSAQDPTIYRYTPLLQEMGLNASASSSSSSDADGDARMAQPDKEVMEALQVQEQKLDAQRAELKRVNTLFNEATTMIAELEESKHSMSRELAQVQQAKASAAEDLVASQGVVTILQQRCKEMAVDLERVESERDAKAQEIQGHLQDKLQYLKTAQEYKMQLDVLQQQQHKRKGAKRKAKETDGDDHKEDKEIAAPIPAPAPAAATEPCAGAEAPKTSRSGRLLKKARV